LFLETFPNLYPRPLLFFEFVVLGNIGFVPALTGIRIPAPDPQWISPTYIQKVSKNVSSRIIL